MSTFSRQELTVEGKDGRILDVIVSGPADGTALVFHYGSPCGLVPLPDDLDPAGLGYRTVLYARPGYSRSTPAPGRVVADAAGDVEAILDALGIDRFLNVGWSGGGPPALACDALTGDRCIGTGIVAGLAPYTLIDELSEARSWYDDDSDNQMALAGDLEGFRRGLADFGEQMSSTTGDGVAANAKAAADRAYLSKGYSEWVAAFFRAGWASGIEGAAGDFLSFLRDWGFPLEMTSSVHIWHGTEDQNVPLSHGQWLAENLPGAQLHVLQNEGHISIIRLLPEILECLHSTT